MAIIDQIASRRFYGRELVIASHNSGKVREVRELLRPFVVKAHAAKDINLQEPDETGSTFAANAELKARAATNGSGLPALADDSGLEVFSLARAPGIYSARWAGGAKDFDSAMRRVEKQLEGITDRRAAFVCALSLAWPDGHVETVEAVAKGNVVWPPRGKAGFGYDPIFVPNGYNTTFGEMEPKIKHRISHRTKAFNKLVLSCFPSRI